VIFFEFAGGDHLGDHHRRGFQRLDLVLAIVAARLVLDDENAERAAGPEDRHAEEGMVDLFAGFREITESRMRLRIGKVERLGGGGDRADETLAHLQLRGVDRFLLEAFGRIKFEDAVGAEHVDRAHLGHHVARDLADDPVKALLRLERLRHQLA